MSTGSRASSFIVCAVCAAVLIVPASARAADPLEASASPLVASAPPLVASAPPLVASVLPPGAIVHPIAASDPAVVADRTQTASDAVATTGIAGEAARRETSARPAPFVPLYLSLAALQALDVHSTLAAIHGGAHEGNPLMQPIVGSPAAMIAVKAATTVSTIFISERLRRRHRAAAVVMMLGVDSAFAIIAAHNYAVSSR